MKPFFIICASKLNKNINYTKRLAVNAIVIGSILTRENEFVYFLMLTRQSAVLGSATQYVSPPDFNDVRSSVPVSVVVLCLFCFTRETA